jgi:phage protein D
MGNFLQNLAQKYQYTEGMSEETFCALNPGLSPANILKTLESLEATEEFHIANKTPNSKKRARLLRANRKRRQKSAMDSILSPGRVAQAREQKKQKQANKNAQRMAERRLDLDFRSQEGAKNTARMAERRLDLEFRSQEVPRILRGWQREG